MAYASNFHFNEKVASEMRHYFPFVEMSPTAENEHSEKVQISICHLHVFKNGNNLMNSTISVLTSCYIYSMNKCIRHTKFLVLRSITTTFNMGKRPAGSALSQTEKLRGNMIILKIYVIQC